MVQALEVQRKMDGPFHVVQVTQVDLVEVVALQTFEEFAYDLVAVEPPDGAPSSQLEDLELLACLDWEVEMEAEVEKVHPMEHWMPDYREKDVYFEPEEPLMLITLSEVLLMDVECYEQTVDEKHQTKPLVSTQLVHYSSYPAHSMVVQQWLSSSSQMEVFGMEVPSNHEEYEKTVVVQTAYQSPYLT